MLNIIKKSSDSLFNHDCHRVKGKVKLSFSCLKITLQYFTWFFFKGSLQVIPSKWFPSKVFALTFMTVGCVFDFQDRLIPAKVGYRTGFTGSRIDVIPLDAWLWVSFVVTVESGRRSRRNTLCSRCVLKTRSICCFVVVSQFVLRDVHVWVKHRIKCCVHFSRWCEAFVLIKSGNQIARRMRKKKKKGWDEKMREEVKPRFKAEKK